MLYSQFKDKKISQLGFGAMRLPLLESGAIDEATAIQMVLEAHRNGVNYFDTAYPYHGGQSEVVLGKALSQLPRDSFYLATKYPGHQIPDSTAPHLYEPARIFEEQLKKCQVDYFDFYMLHNVYERSLPVYLDEQLGIMDYFLKEREAGRIKYLGFSTHGQLDCMREILERFGNQMDFCQIQLNYLDWTLQDGKEKMELLREFDMPVIVMEPVRGGSLASLKPEIEEQLKQLRPSDSIASWTFNWLKRHDVVTTLSGMTTMDQLQDNLLTYDDENALSDEEAALIERIAADMVDICPCTACRYCCEGCPSQLDIPLLLKLANDARFKPSFNVGMTVDSLPQGRRPEDCTQCGACVGACPQGIDIPAYLSEFVHTQEGVPHWADLIKSREALIG